MSETSKYDLFMEELASLEKMLHNFIQKNEELAELKKVLEKKVNQLEKENEVLILKIEELESKLNNIQESDNPDNSNEGLKLEERESLKSQINDLIERIDYHIRS